MGHAKLVMMRHGLSAWNQNNRFTGWVDIPLSSDGIKEALKAGERIAEIDFDVIYVSTLMRASMTAMLAMSIHKSGKVPMMLHEEKKLKEWGQVYDDGAMTECIPVISAWQLNERMYGELQGKNKDKMREEYGKEQVHIWRRSYDVPPPKGESLEMTAGRTIPYFEQEILPRLKKGENVLISAHGNSLRSIVMDLDHLSKEEVLALEIPTGVPIIYECDEQGKCQKVS